MIARAPRRRRSRSLERPLLRLAAAAGAFQGRIQRRPAVAAVAVGAITAALGAGLTRFEVENRTTAWVSDDEEIAGAPEAFEGEGRDFLIVVRREVDPASSAFLRDDADLAAALAGLPGVAGVESVSGVLERLGRRRLEDLGDAARFLDGHLLFAARRVAVQRVWIEPEAPYRVVRLHGALGLASARPRESLAFRAAWWAHRSLARPLRLAAPLALVAAAAALPGLRVRHEPLRFFAEDNPFRRECAAAGSEIEGLAPLEVEVAVPAAAPASRKLELLARAAGRHGEHRPHGRLLGAGHGELPAHRPLRAPHDRGPRPHPRGPARGAAGLPLAGSPLPLASGPR
ncbi:MAG: hypothetical protein HY721_35275 [Planctomycetes bacterium]|nr:hypothetical protein [Planctomycetota bacterium]